MSTQLRTDYPRPQFVREQWMNLNGEWEFEFDDLKVGDREKWYRGDRGFTKRIQVPFSFESQLSGIQDTSFHDIVWYRKKITLDTLDGKYESKRIILHFGAVDYEATVWVNGDMVVTHEGGHTPFFADVTDAIQKGDNIIVVKAVDYGKDVFLPRGKQFWEEKSKDIWYTRTTGIWQTVWLESVSPVYLNKVKFTADIDHNEVAIRSFVKGFTEAQDIRMKINITFEGEAVAEDLVLIKAAESNRKIKLYGLNDHSMDRFWRPEKPNLYDVEFTLIVNGEPVDQVQSYFGMRKISIENGKFNLNNRPYVMKLVLDQGYFPDGNLTPPSDEAIKRDVELTKEMGFNGARKHQKVEDPRYLYWCDKLGLLVWGEMANAYDYSVEYVRKITNEWQAVIDRDYNHPSLVVWVPLNESWGVPNIQIDEQQQQHAMTMYYLTKSLDPTRPVISNDGWEQVKTDLFNIHDYEWRQEVLEERYSSSEKAVTAMPANRRLAVGEWEYNGQPILITEFGGIAYKKSDWEGWGYSGAENDEDFISRLRAVIRPLLISGVVQGYCYTQLTDVEQEINGLLTYDRKPKVPLDQIKQIVDGDK